MEGGVFDIFYHYLNNVFYKHIHTAGRTPNAAAE